MKIYEYMVKNMKYNVNEWVYFNLFGKSHIFTFVKTGVQYLNLTDYFVVLTFQLLC